MAREPKWRRRKEARPADIAAAALAVFAEKGFAGARIEEIAARAGISKGTLYLYYHGKAELFRAVVREVVIPNVDAMRAAFLAADLPFATVLRQLLPRFAEIVTRVPVGAVAKMVIGESRNFPELAKVWHDEVIDKALGLIATLIERGAGERRGPPRRPAHPRFLDHGADADRRALARDLHAGRRRRARSSGHRPPACRDGAGRPAHRRNQAMKPQRLVILVLLALALAFLAWRWLASRFRRRRHAVRLYRGRDALSLRRPAPAGSRGWRCGAASGSRRAPACS